MSTVPAPFVPASARSQCPRCGTRLTWLLGQEHAVEDAPLPYTWSIWECEFPEGCGGRWMERPGGGLTLLDAQARPLMEARR